MSLLFFSLFFQQFLGYEWIDDDCFSSLSADRFLERAKASRFDHDDEADEGDEPTCPECGNRECMLTPSNLSYMLSCSLS